MSDIQKLGASRFMPADYSIGRYAATVPSETTLEDVLHPEYFANHFSVFKQGMRIDVISDDMKLDCELRVVGVSKTAAKLRVLRVYDEKKAIKQPTAELTPPGVNHGGPHHKWRFLHGGNVVQHGFDTKEAAEKAAEKYIELLKGE